MLLKHGLIDNKKDEFVVEKPALQPSSNSVANTLSLMKSLE